MTKRNLTLGTASGKLGSVVYFRRRGQQIARVLVSQVNDKKTINQCYVRGRFANYVNLWRLLRPYIEGSWRGVSRYGSPENAFAKHNKGLIPVCSSQMSREGYAFPNFGLVTYGSLPTSLNVVYDNYPPVGGGGDQWAAWLTNTAAAGIPQTIGQLSEILVSGSTGVVEGDIVHILVYTYSFDPIDFAPAAALEQAPVVFHYAIKMDKTSRLTLAANAPAIKWFLGDAGAAGAILGAGLDASALPDVSDDYSIGRFFTMFVERPTNPRYSRYSRSRFVMQDAERIYLYNMSVGQSNFGLRYAETWRNV